MGLLEFFRPLAGPCDDGFVVGVAPWKIFEPTILLMGSVMFLVAIDCAFFLWSKLVKPWEFTLFWYAERRCSPDRGSRSSWSFLFHPSRNIGESLERHQFLKGFVTVATFWLCLLQGTRCFVQRALYHASNKYLQEEKNNLESFFSINENPAWCYLR